MDEQKELPLTPEDIIKEVIWSAMTCAYKNALEHPGEGLLNFYTPESFASELSTKIKQYGQPERKLRDLLWATHACPGKYCDDGELQCSCFLPPIDFLRDKPEDIETKIPLHNAQLLEQKRRDRPDREKIALIIGGYSQLDKSNISDIEWLQLLNKADQLLDIYDAELETSIKTFGEDHPEYSVEDFLNYLRSRRGKDVKT